MNRMEETDKLMQVLEAIEHPEKYTDDELRQLLSDGECSEYYRLMSDAASAYADTPDEIDVDAEWERFHRQHFPKVSLWRKVAAVFIGILMVSGISYAAIRLISSEGNTVQDVSAPEVQAYGQQKTPVDEELVDTVYTFQDAELQEILSQLASHYQLHTEYLNEQARHVRLYIKWNKTEDAQTMVERLNRFNKVNVKLANGLITAE